MSHSAALFRQAMSNPYTGAGVLGLGELAVGAQSTPNMSVQVGAGRAKVAGSQISPPTLLSGATAAFTTQAMYDVLNDNAVSLTIATSNPTNPRIDTVYIGVQDSFYSGSNDQALLGVVTGTPAPSPVAPAAPSNSLVLGYVAVAANATSIVAANITSLGSPASTLAPTSMASQLLVPPTVAGTGVQVSSLGKVTLTASTGVSLNNIFTSQYDNYRILASVTTSASSLLSYQLRVGGSDATGLYYSYDGLQGSGNAASSAVTGAATTEAYWNNQAGTQTDVDVAVYGPAQVATTRLVSTFYVAQATQIVGVIGSTEAQGIAFDGISIRPGTGGVTMTGTVRIYGWNNG